MKELAAANSAPNLIATIQELGLTKAAKPFLFELRFAHALHRAGIEAAYEIPGEGESTIDFGFKCDSRQWRVELMRLEETKAVKDATSVSVDEHGAEWFAMSMSSNAEDKRQSQEGETLKAIERICQKCERDGRPHKFPAPDDDAFNVLLIDMRTFIGGGDEADRLHIALGSDAVGEWYKMHWNGKPIGGVFAGENPCKGTAEIRERVHFLGFVNEEAFEDGSFGKSIQFVFNPHLFATSEEAKSALGDWPLEQKVLLNAP